ncbi:hypothetical protein [Rhizobium grahamii]|uniref:Uncharacterized protein n=1 Tax=Rhizobium grahamii TaxID=1120045 RepID=A0A370KHS4_9HYPH|nr:hypothetical protein [Rhizobium grahamii]RDJ05085.1 hypothetical protein B5K06_26310 [Rhizobium grahamii]
MAYDDIDKVTDWSLPNILFLWHRYNGVTNEYSKRGIPSPYLWSGSQLYKKGKYVADRKFDPEAVSKQVGAAVLLRTLLELKAIEIGSDKSVQTNILAAAGSVNVLATENMPGTGMESANRCVNRRAVCPIPNTVYPACEGSRMLPPLRRFAASPLQTSA